MLGAGDELGRTQQGNNNAYCQDNEISWVNWQLTERDRELPQFTIRCLDIRRNNPVLRRRAFFRGAPVGEAAHKDVAWIRPDGHEFGEAEWHDRSRRGLGMLIQGHATDEVDERGRLITGNTLLLIVNGGDAVSAFHLPTLEQPGM